MTRVIAVTAAFLVVSCFRVATPADTVGNAPVLLTASTGAATTAGAWHDGPPLPTEIAEIAGAALDGSIYTGGGFTPPGSRISVWFGRLVVSRDAWERLADLPLAVHHPHLVAAAGRVYLSGGYTGALNVSAASNQLHGYDPAQDRWTRLTDMPGRRAAGFMVALGDHLYVLGGIGDAPDAMWAYDIGANTWRSLPGPTPREHLGAAGSGGSIYAVAGRGYGRGNVGILEAFDPARGTWQRLADMPGVCGGCSAAATADGRIHVTGGEGGGRTYNDHYVFDPASGTWETAEPMPTRRHGIATAGVGKRFYVIGGGPTQGLAYSTTVEWWEPISAAAPSATPDEETPTTAPPLPTVTPTGSPPPGATTPSGRHPPCHGPPVAAQPSTRRRPSPLMEAVACDLCGADDPEVLYAGSAWVRALPAVAMVRCRRCGLMYLSPRPIASEVGQYYPEDYGPFRGAIEDESSPLMRRMRRSKLTARRRMIEKHAPPGRILDVGCSTGLFLHEMALAGWQADGVELSPRAAGYARERFGLKVHGGLLEEAPLEPGSLDAITLWDVLEHTFSATQTLRTAARLLRPGGIVALNRPPRPPSGRARARSKPGRAAPPCSTRTTFPRRTRCRPGRQPRLARCEGGSCRSASPSPPRRGRRRGMRSRLDRSAPRFR